MSQQKILIVGAGPTGLTAAVLLHRYGIPFRIIDQQIKPVQTSNALAVQARTLEIWDDLGILANALETGIKLRRLKIYSHHEVIAALEVDLLDSEYAFVLALAQRETETILLNYLRSANITVEMQVTLTELLPSENGAEVFLTHPDNSVEKTQVDWLIACDGAHSTIRQKLHLPFQGKELPQRFFLADLIIECELPRDTLHGYPSKDGLLFLIPFDRDSWRLIVDITSNPELQNLKNITQEVIYKLIQDRAHLNLNIAKCIWTSEFKVNERMIANFAHDRILFLGDAAHIHSPAGGQGMNISIQDAYNLIWKLALVIQGQATPEILKTYTDERKPIATEILQNTSRLTWLMTIQNPFFITLRNHLLALLLKSKAIQKKLLNTLGELNFKYENNELVRDYSPLLKGPKAGSRVIDVKYNEKRLFDDIRGPEFVLLLFMGLNENIKINALASEIQKLKLPNFIKPILVRTANEFIGWDYPTIFDETKLIHQHYEAKEACFYLIRPDKYIGARGEIKKLNKLNDYFKFSQIRSQ